MMKKTILSIAFVTAALFGSTAFAANPADNSAQCSGNCPTACVAKGEKGATALKGKKQARQARRDPMKAFEGINLTDTQKSSIAKLQADREAVRQARRQKTDSTARSQRPDRRQARLDYFKAVSVILTPDQYVTFLENIAAGQPKMEKAQGKRGDKGNAKAKKDRGGKKNDRRQKNKTNQQS